MLHERIAAMRRHILSFLLAALLLSPAVRAADAPAAFAITDVRVFDGTSLSAPKMTVVVRDGKIAAVGPKAAIPEGATVIDGAGGTLLPGFIDSHTHSWGDALVRALVFGVTTELDMFSDPQLAKAMRAEQAAPGGAPGRADLYSAGILATVPGGHGTEYGFEIPTLTRPDEAQAWVDARIAEGSDYIKIVDEDGSAYGRKIPSLDKATIAALVKAAHARGKLAVVHVSSAAGARRAIEAGADGLAHIFADQAAPDLARLAVQHKAFVIPTLTVVESTTGVASGKSLTADLRLKGYLTQDEVTGLSRAFPSHADLQVALDTVRQLRDAGVPVLAGTDAPNPGTTHGASIHRELELLVKAGLTPEQALAAATSVPARIFKLGDRGRIAPGLRADLVLVGGSPTKDITDTRNIVRIWKGGVPFDRSLAPTSAPTETKTTAPALAAGGLISDFDDGTAAARFGSWADSTDALRGGASVVHKEVVDGGAEGTAKALEISGEVKPGFAFPWSGVIFFPGKKPMAAADLSAAGELVFWAKGDGRTSYQVLLFATSLGPMPAQKPFTAGPEWTRFAFPLKDFPGVDPHGLLGVFFGAVQEPGTFRFRIDGVRLAPAQTRP
jgi:imidazolonepropionase-like amidohydrolase